MPSPKVQKTSGDHRGFGKVILFGEHLVVYGAPAIVAAVSQYTQCSLEVTPNKAGWEVVDNRPAVPGYIVAKAAEQRIAHELVFKHLNIDTSKDGLKITIGGPLVPSSGIGASASDVVALSRALNEMYGLNMTEHQINDSGYAGECGYHGTPSGVDNTAATFGGLLSFKRQAKKSHFAAIKLSVPMYLVVVGTGITASTTTVVGDVKRLKESEPKVWDAIMGQYAEIVAAANKAIAAGDLVTVGKLMNRNHTLMQYLTVSCKELEAIVGAARKLGALGAKMSGTGRGGIAIALCSSIEQQKKVAEGLKATCPEAKFIWQYSVDVKDSKL